MRPGCLYPNIMAAREKKFNPVIDLIKSQEWDGVPRLASWLADVFEVEDRRATEAGVQRRRIERDRRQRDPRLHAALQLDELDLQVFVGGFCRKVLGDLIAALDGRSTQGGPGPSRVTEGDWRAALRV